MAISPLTKVRDILADLYTNAHDTRRLAADAGLDLRRIDFTGQALNNWQVVLAEAEKINRIEPLLELVQAEYPDHPELAPAVEQYRTGAADPGDSPFKGLQYFDTNDAHLFFGREALTAELVERLRHQRFLAVVGASGSGKSSLVRAGLVPTLQRKKVLTDGIVLPAGSEHWPIHLIRPTERPLKELATSLTAGESDKMTLALMDDLKEDGRVLDMRASKLLSKQAPTSNRLVVVVDQFEETFTLCRDKVERQAFVDNLLTAATVDGPVIVVITLRADFYAHCAEFENLRAALESYQRFIGPMKREELRRAIEAPAHQNGWAFEPGLVELLLDDVGDEPGGLPLLSHALLETWKRRRGRQLTFTGYSESGRVQGAIAQTAQTIYQALKPEQQNIARNIFLRLTELGEGSEDTRRRVIRQDLIPHIETGSTVESVLKTLADARLLTIDQDSAEVAHEALIREWPQLREWLADDREGLRVHRRLTEAAQEWQTLGRDTGALLRGMRLDQTAAWAAEQGNILNKLEQEYLNASRSELEREIQEEKAARQRELTQAQALLQEQKQRTDEQAKAAVKLKRGNTLLSVASGIALLLALAAVGFGVRSSQNFARAAASEADLKIAVVKALDAEAIARLNEEDAKRKALVAQQEKTRADLAAVEAQIQERIAKKQERIAVAGLRVGQSLMAEKVQSDRVESQPLLLAREAVLTTWITDTEIITRSFITMEADRALRNALANESPWQLILPAHRHAKPIWGVAYSPDGKTVITAGDDQTAGIWDVQTGRQVTRLIGHQHIIHSVNFSPDGQVAITTSPDGTARLWDVQSGAQIGVLTGKGVSDSAAFSPDGRLIATGGAIPEIRLWDAQTLQEAGQLRGHAEWIRDVAFSPDGKYLVSSSQDKTARIWDLATGETIHLLEGFKEQVRTVAFSPDGTQVATGSFDRSVRLWDVATGQEVYNLEGHKRNVRDVAFSPDGKLLVSGSEDRTAIIWERATGKIQQTIQSYSAIHGAKFSPDSMLLVTADADRSVRFWEVDSGREVRHLEGHIKAVTAVAYSPDGKLIASAGHDRNIHLWDPQSGSEIRVLRGITDEVYSTVFSPDSRWLASGAKDGSVRLWDVTSGQAITRMANHDDVVQAVVFSPDGKWLASASADQTIRLWSVSNGKEEQRFTGHTGAIASVDFSPDGERLISVSSDDTLRLWNVSTGKEMRKFQGAISGLKVVTFSPDGATVATGGSDNILRVWNVELGTEVRTLVGHEGAIRSVAFNSDGKMLLTGSEDWGAHLWDVVTQSTIRRYDGHSGPVTTAVFSPDGKRVVTGSDDRTVRVWESNPTPPVTVFNGHTDDVNWAVFSPDGKTIASGSTDETVRLWDLATGETLWQETASEDGELGGVSFSPDGKLLATGADDNKARLWDVATGKELRIFEGHEKEVIGVNFSPNNDKLVTASVDGTARVWDVQTGKELGILQGHTDQVRGAAFSPDGKTIATTSYDRTAKLWDATTYQEIRTFEGHTFHIFYVMFSKDGKRILTASNDRTARIWDVETGQELQKFGQHPAAVQTAAFSPDERYVVTACDDNSVNLWDVATGVNIRRIEDHTREINSAFFNPDGKWIVSTSDDRTIRLWLTSIEELLKQANQRIQRDPPILQALIAR